jgi:transposase-like protein
MERPHRSFTENYKHQAVELVLSSRRSVTAVAKELGLRDSMLRLQEHGHKFPFHRPPAVIRYG